MAPEPSKGMELASMPGNVSVAIDDIDGKVEDLSIDDT